MPDYEFKSIYETPINKLVENEEIIQEFADGVINKLSQFTQFHHRVYPVIYCADEALYIVFIDSNLVVSFAFQHPERGVNRFMVATVYGADLISLFLNEIKNYSMKVLLTKFVG